MLQPLLVPSQTRMLSDEERIEEALRDGFSPHRCVVEFQSNRTKVALHLYGTGGNEFDVAAIRVDVLRDPDSLSRYIRDVRYHLQQRKLKFSTP